MKTILTLFIALTITLSVFPEQINLAEITLSLDDCLQMAETTSYEAMKNRLEVKNTDLSLIKTWLEDYLPELAYSIDYDNAIIDTGEETGVYNYPIDAESSRERNSLVHNLTFKQRIFDTALLDKILATKYYDKQIELLKKGFIANIRYSMRILYYNTLIMEEQIRRYETYINNYTLDKPENNDLKKFLSLLNDQLILDLNNELLTLKNMVKNNKLLILKMIKKPLDKKLYLSSELSDFKPDYEKDIATAIANNHGLIIKSITKSQKQMALGKTIMDLFPKLRIDLNTEVADNLNLGLDINIDGSSIKADIFGNYMLYKKENELYLSKLNEKMEYDSHELTLENYDVKTSNLSIMGVIKLDKMVNSGVDIQQKKNDIMNVNIGIQEKKDEIKYSLKSTLDKIAEYREKMTILTRKNKTVINNKELLFKLMNTPDGDLITFYDTLLHEEIDTVRSFYDMKRQVYEKVAVYNKILDGDD